MIITIIGLGLIGGSLAKAIKSRTEGHTIYAINRSQAGIETALAEGTIALGSDKFTSEMADSDIVFVCTPARASEKWISEIAPKVKKGCIITDACSTKTEICEFADSINGDFRFVGGHPMSGSEKSGYSAANESLFENTYYIFTKSAKSDDAAIETLKKLAQEIGAIPVAMTPQDHDRAVAAVSHLPHVLSAVLMNTAEELDDDGSVLKFAAGGFRDVTRIAASEPVMWRDITFSNKESIINMLDLFIDNLEAFKEQIKSGKTEEVEEYYASAREMRTKLPQKAAALAHRNYECILDVPDRVGVIAQIAVLLGDAGINMKNIYVSNSREFYGGVLVISLGSMADLEKAKKLFSENGFEVKG
ncbi:MAG: prephenate dehydrogenase [Clostridia bacterium]|nr:prephenate dehydrogenase [Clostridia bacterium]